MSRIVKWLSITSFVLLVMIIGYATLLVKHRVVVTQNKEFVLDVPYDTMKKILVRSDATERLVAANNATIISQDWKGISLTGEKWLKPSTWTVDAHGYFTLKVDNPVLGPKVMVVRQDASLGPEKTMLSTTLTQPVGEMHHYNVVMKLTKDGEKTNVKITMTVEIHWRSPQLDFIKQKVVDLTESEVSQSLKNIQATFEDLVKKNAGSKIFLKVK